MADFELSKAIPDLNFYVAAAAKWSPKRIPLVGNDYDKAYTYNRVNDRAFNKTKIQFDCLSVPEHITSSATAEPADKRPPPRRTRNVYEIMSVESRSSEDTGFHDYMSKMSHMLGAMYLDRNQIVEDLSEHFDLGREPVIRQWAVLQHYGVPPNDRELYTYCYTLLKRRTVEVREEIDITKLSEGHSGVDDLRKMWVCNVTGWPLDIVNKSSKDKQGSASMLLSGWSFCKEVQEGYEDRTKLMGCEKIIVRQLRELGRHSLRIYSGSRKDVTEFVDVKRETVVKPISVPKIAMEI